MSETMDIAVTTELAIFSVQDGALRVLLETGATDGLPKAPFPGDADLDRFAAALLSRLTGFDGVYIEQLYSFGRRSQNTAMTGVTVAYFALIPPAVSSTVRSGLYWQPLNENWHLPNEQREVLELATQRLRDKLGYSSIALPLMPEEFTLGHLQEVYEIIGGEALDKRNFRKRILSLAYVEETGRQRRNGSHRPAMLYRARNPGRVEILR
ncbi:MAG: NUDIX hydrolase [Chromatiales bacterium]|nr:NUDIX hydrolase [Chromatiales bacterium]